jgi:hypothetical protein
LLTDPPNYVALLTPSVNAPQITRQQKSAGLTSQRLKFLGGDQPGL